jgi:hypothetical protein
MKCFAFIFLFTFPFTGRLIAHNTDMGRLSDGEDTPLSLIVTAGYIPKPSVKALKSSIAFNNLLLKRIGVYTSLEKGLDSGFFTNIYGITGTVHRNVYLWGGVEIFTKQGLLNSESEGFKKARKEFGIGILPVRNLVVKGGWSKSVGITFEAGVRIPL